MRLDSRRRPLKKVDRQASLRFLERHLANVATTAHEIDNDQAQIKTGLFLDLLILLLRIHIEQSSPWISSPEPGNNTERSVGFVFIPDEQHRWTFARSRSQWESFPRFYIFLKVAFDQTPHFLSLDRFLDLHCLLPFS